jgi:hypothetical protein
MSVFVALVKELSISINWLGLHGTVAATSLQKKYSTVNKLFRDHQQQPIAVGELLADTRRGLEDARRGLKMQEQRILASDARLHIPAPQALTLPQSASQTREHLAWTPIARQAIAQFRATLGICTVYAKLKLNCLQQVPSETG